MSERISATLQEVETHWSLDDLLDAHALLDAFDDAQRKATSQRARR